MAAKNRGVGVQGLGLGFRVGGGGGCGGLGWVLWVQAGVKTVRKVVRKPQQPPFSDGRGFVGSMILKPDTGNRTILVRALRKLR